MLKEPDAIFVDGIANIAKACFISIDSNLRNWLKNDKSFGMEVVVSSDDFWEILPVLIKGN